MQAPLYKLPHRSVKWNKRKQHMQNILKLEDIDSIIKEMNNINQKYQWKQSTFNDTKPQQQLIQILKFATKCCLQVQNLFPLGIPISSPSQQLQSQTHIILTKKQALCLVCNMFFGTTCQQPDKKNLPIYYDFNRLSRRSNEIIKTMFNYFQRCQQISEERMKNQNIVYFRIAETPILQSWKQCENKLCQVRFHQKGSIQDLGENIQIDFANKSIGGFFLSQTYTQQDIIFINSPQLMPAVLFHQYMERNQCILMVGAERFSRYTGYLQTYKFAGNFEDDRKLIPLKLSETEIVNVKDSWISAIDAMPYFLKSQFNNENMNRQLKKAFVGFNIMKLDKVNKNISTGNWGSGAFNGNLQYKFLIQWLAASRANRSIDYYSFDDGRAKGIPQIIKIYSQHTVKDLVQILIKNSQHFQNTRKIFQTLNKKEEQNNLINDKIIDLQ